MLLNLANQPRGGQPLQAFEWQMVVVDERLWPHWH
jgi:hypothetical protein